MSLPVVGVNPVQQTVFEPQTAVQAPVSTTQTFFYQVSDRANWAWNYSVQKVVDLKDSVCCVVMKVIGAVISFFEKVRDWFGYRNPESLETQQAVIPLIAGEAEQPSGQPVEQAVLTLNDPLKPVAPAVAEFHEPQHQERVQVQVAQLPQQDEVDRASIAPQEKRPARRGWFW